MNSFLSFLIAMLSVMVLVMAYRLNRLEQDFKIVVEAQSQMIRWGNETANKVIDIERKCKQ